MMFESEFDCWLLLPNKGNVDMPVRHPLPPRVESDDVSSRIGLLAFPSTRGSRLIMFQSEYGCLPFLPPDGRDR